MFVTSVALHDESKDMKRAGINDEAPYWTMLLLSPSGLISETEIKSHENSISRHVKLSAEVAFIIIALKEVVKRWTDLDTYISGLLAEDFIDSENFIELLFDDESFSRSKLYFWLISCLNEFDASIGDNIKQWELFRLARLNPYLPSDAKLQRDGSGKPPASSSDQTGHTMGPEIMAEIEVLDKQAEDLRESLENLRSGFQNKLGTVGILRSGVSCVPSSLLFFIF